MIAKNKPGAVIMPLKLFRNRIYFSYIKKTDKSLLQNWNETW